MKTLIINIKELLQVREAGIDKISGKDMATLPHLNNAYLLIDGNVIAAFGPMSQCPDAAGMAVIDAAGKTVRKQNIQAPKGFSTYSIKGIELLSPGVYFVRAEFEGTVATYKIVK